MPELGGRSVAELYSELQLPLDPTTDDAAISVVRAVRTSDVQSEQDLVILLREAMDHWREGGAPNALIREVVTAALGTRTTENGTLDGKQYLSLYGRLRAGTADTVGLNHVLAIRLLSRTTLIAHLLQAERLSCSQIARLLQATESRLDVPANAVQVIAGALGLKPSLDPDYAGAPLWAADQERSLEYFPDSNLADSCEAAGHEIARWAPEENTASMLLRLSKSSEFGEPNWPYLQILHWCSTALEFYDHPASFLYEFKPRGIAGNEVFKHYPTVTGNPVLNNAKAVAALDRTWARNRGSDDAHALVNLLTMLEALPFAARRQVARVLRAWLVRVIELETIEPRPLRGHLGYSEVLHVAKYLAKHESNTRGVLEQRIVDALSTLVFAREGWRPKGIGDGINASNLSRNKLGDVEFTSLEERTAIALEAHGGHLSQAYVRDHQRSLSRVLNRRLRESWADLDAPTAWTVRVIFVAHTQAESLPSKERVHGVSVRYEYIDYDRLIEMATDGQSPEALEYACRTLVIDALNSETVRESVREKFRQILRLRGDNRY